eukprot:146038-Chlamydomonas_euryale.AAC.1
MLSTAPTARRLPTALGAHQKSSPPTLPHFRPHSWPHRSCPAIGLSGWCWASKAVATTPRPQWWRAMGGCSATPSHHRCGIHTLCVHNRPRPPRTSCRPCARWHPHMCCKRAVASGPHLQQRPSAIPILPHT